MERKSGVLMPIFSLPSKYGIGGFGKESYKFVDFLKSAGQKVWQILPLVQTGYGNSPYSSICSNSFNPYFIDIDGLKERGLLTNAQTKFAKTDCQTVDYGNLYSVIYPLLRSAFSKFDLHDKDFVKFVKSKEYYDYALFMAIKNSSGQKHFYEWDEKLCKRDEKALKLFARQNKQELLFWQFVQFTAKNDWQKLKKYANDNGVSILGDMPFYVALDSVDVWKNPHLFKLTSDFKPTKVAGVPPDYFSKDGQLWGNPVYDFEVHQNQNFKWWVDRIKGMLSIYDYLRIDHFRAFDKYYEIDFGRQDAREGEWVKVPSKELFRHLHANIDKNKIIAEDLGIIDDGVRQLLSEVNYPGMKILSFAFNGDEDNLYLPKNIIENSVCYTGTHDNDTLMGLIQNASEWDKNQLVNSVKRSLEEQRIDGQTDCDEGLALSIIKLGFFSKANTFIIPMQDILFYGSEYRINQPGKVSNRNWSIRLKNTDFNLKKAKKLMQLTRKSKRI